MSNYSVEDIKKLEQPIIDINRELTIISQNINLYQKCLAQYIPKNHPYDSNPLNAYFPIRPLIPGEFPETENIIIKKFVRLSTVYKDMYNSPNKYNPVFIDANTFDPFLIYFLTTYNKLSYRFNYLLSKLIGLFCLRENITISTDEVLELYYLFCNDFSNSNFIMIPCELQKNENNLFDNIENLYDITFENESDKNDVIKEILQTFSSKASPGYIDIPYTINDNNLKVLSINTPSTEYVTFLSGESSFLLFGKMTMTDSLLKYVQPYYINPLQANIKLLYNPFYPITINSELNRGYIYTTQVELYNDLLNSIYRSITNTNGSINLMCNNIINISNNVSTDINIGEITQSCTNELKLEIDTIIEKLKEEEDKKKKEDEDKKKKEEEKKKEEKFIIY